MRRILATLSRVLCRITGGPSNKTLCWRAAMRWGDDCFFCRLVAAALGERHHCADELTAADIVARARKRKQ